MSPSPLVISIVSMISRVLLYHPMHGFFVMMPRRLSIHVCRSSRAVTHSDAEYLVVRHWDHFTACIYTPQEYYRDQEVFEWGLRERSFSYRSIHSKFVDVIESQQEVLLKRDDIRVLCQCVQRLSRLVTIRLSFSEPDNSQLPWFSNRSFMDWDYSFAVHLEAILRAIQSAQLQGIRVSSLEIHEFYASITDSAFVELASCALADIKYICLENSVNLLNLLTQVPLPSLVQIEVGSCWIMDCELRTFQRKHDPDDRKLILRAVQLYTSCESSPRYIK